jgi:dTDP-4-dehydrorhamnose reductase
MSRPTLLLTGSTGFIGRRLLSGLTDTWRVVGASRSGEHGVALDLANRASIARAFDAVRPAAVVHTGAVSAPDVCEREPTLARRINTDSVEAIAELCAKGKARLIHFSTDLVFDGEKSWYHEDAATRPIQVYGQTKLDAEQAVLGLCADGVILRVSNCYGRPLGGRPCYVEEWRTTLAAGRRLSAFTDQWRTSTAADQFVQVVQRLLQSEHLKGIFHWGGSDRTSRYESAIVYCNVMGFDDRLVRPTLALKHGFLAARPSDTSLDSSKLASALALQPLGLRQGYEALRPFHFH